MQIYSFFLSTITFARFSKIFSTIIVHISAKFRPSFTSTIQKSRSRENVPQLHHAGTYVLGIIIFYGGEEARRREADEPSPVVINRRGQW